MWARGGRVVDNDMVPLFSDFQLRTRLAKLGFMASDLKELPVDRAREYNIIFSEIDQYNEEKSKKKSK